MSLTDKKYVNLIPQDRQEHRLRKMWVRRWSSAAIGAAFVIGIPSLYIGGNAVLSDSGIADQIQLANIEYEANQARVPILKAQLSKLKAEQEVYDLIENRIQWRDVFGILIRSAGNRVRFSSLYATGGGVEGDEKIEIYLEGFAQSQSDARSYIVDLESTQVFDSIELIETSREKIDGQELIGFRVLILVESKNVIQKGNDDEPG